MQPLKIGNTPHDATPRNGEWISRSEPIAKPYCFAHPNHPYASKNFETYPIRPIDIPDHESVQKSSVQSQKDQKQCH